MARGNSGRIVLEVDPGIKRELYDALDKDGFTLREWFLKEANRYLEERIQLPLFETVGRIIPSEAIAKPINDNSKTSGNEF